MSRKDKVWTDDRRAGVWVVAIGGIVWLGLALTMAFAMTMIALENFEKSSAKFEMLGICAFGMVVSIYACAGVFQALVLERRRAFIVWKISLEDTLFTVSGLFGKSDSFYTNEIECVGVHAIKRESIKSIMTLMAWRTENYLISTTNGRKFYLSKDMDKDGSLGKILEECCSKNFV